MMLRATLHRLLAGLVLALMGTALLAQRSTVPGTYSAAQATSGKATYDQYCAGCHMVDLRGSAGPELAGPNFRLGWNTRTSRELLQYIRGTMPPGAERSLSDDAYLNIVAYILQANGHAAGSEPLPADATVAIE